MEVICLPLSCDKHFHDGSRFKTIYPSCVALRGYSLLCERENQKQELTREKKRREQKLMTTK